MTRLNSYFNPICFLEMFLQFLNVYKFDYNQGKGIFNQIT